MAFHYLAFSMAMVVSTFIKTNIYKHHFSDCKLNYSINLGQEVALYVKKYYTKILTNLPSFKAKNYRLALEESFMKIDE